SCATRREPSSPFTECRARRRRLRREAGGRKARPYGTGDDRGSWSLQDVGAGLVPARAPRKCDRREAGGRKARPYGTGDDRGSWSFQNVGEGLAPSRLVVLPPVRLLFRSSFFRGGPRSRAGTGSSLGGR